MQLQARAVWASLSSGKSFFTCTIDYAVGERFCINRAHISSLGPDCSLRDRRNCDAKLSHDSSSIRICRNFCSHDGVNNYRRKSWSSLPNSFRGGWPALIPAGSHRRSTGLHCWPWMELVPLCLNVVLACWFRRVGLWLPRRKKLRNWCAPLSAFIICKMVEERERRRADRSAAED